MRGLNLWTHGPEGSAPNSPALRQGWGQDIEWENGAAVGMAKGRAENAARGAETRPWDAGCPHSWDEVGTTVTTATM